MINLFKKQKTIDVTVLANMPVDGKFQPDGQYTSSPHINRDHRKYRSVPAANRYC